MSALIEELKKDHIKLVGVLDEIKTLNSASSELKSKLNTVKDGFLDHLKKEDDQLYPVLKKAAEDDDNLKQTLDLFAKEMEEISGFALDFFKKYSASGDNSDFAKDFGKLLANFGQRIRREEKVLYFEYDKIKS
ncbi:MAG: hemerythrin domain-containing protein [Spirochaetota bacterium]|nr:hemerythrin domain-containing protein [Spirochaetota bacterium]